MGNFQVCANLEVNNDYQELRKNGDDALTSIFSSQKKMQEDVYGYNFDELRTSIGKLKK